MRTTVAFDNGHCHEVHGVKERSVFIQRALKELVEREAGHRMAALGGTDPFATAAPRRRPPYFLNPE